MAVKHNNRGSHTSKSLSVLDIFFNIMQLTVVQRGQIGDDASILRLQNHVMWVLSGGSVDTFYDNN